MTRWQPLKQDVLDATATEIVDAYPRGRIAVAVDGADAAQADRFADDLAAAIESTGRAVEQARLLEAGNQAGQQSFRTEVLDPFLAGADPADRVLLVSGSFLLTPDLRGLWHYSIRLDGGVERMSDDEQRYVHESSPRTRAVAIIDVTDPDHPRRVFADSC